MIATQSKANAISTTLATPFVTPSGSVRAMVSPQGWNTLKTSSVGKSFSEMSTSVEV